VSVAIAGARVAGLVDRLVLINADNGSSDHTPDLFARACDGLPYRLLRTGDVGGGKGTNVFAILRAAIELDPDVVILLDADVRSIEPSWVGTLHSAVLDERPAMAVPVYRRNRFEGNTTNHLISPMMGAVLGVWVQQPIAGDFALNRALLHRVLTWTVPDSATMYGIDVHLTAHTAREGWPLRQVPLGRKLHNPGFPKILYGSQQVLDSFFHAISGVGQCQSATEIPDRYESADTAAVGPDATLVATTVAKALHYLARYERSIATLFPSVTLARQAEWGLHIDGPLWARVLADALSGVAAGHAATVRDHLVALYLSRVMSYWREIEHAEPEQIDALLRAQAQAVREQVGERRLSFAEADLPRRFEPGYWRQGPR
jgi:hypothetical protein